MAQEREGRKAQPTQRECNPGGKCASSHGAGERASVALASSKVQLTTSFASQCLVSMSRRVNRRVGGAPVAHGDLPSITNASEEADPYPMPRVPSDVSRKLPSPGNDYSTTRRR